MNPFKRSAVRSLRFTVYIAIALGVSGAVQRATADSIVVIGHHSNNVVKFDLDTGEAQVIAKLANGSRPRGVAISPAQEIFISLMGAKKNVVKLVPSRPDLGPVPMIAVDVTPQIGRYGPGQLAFDADGALVVAGDTERAIQRYNAETGELIESLKSNHKANLVGLTVSGKNVLAAEYFQKTVLQFSLSDDPPTSTALVSRSERLDRPHGMSVGHNDNLFVSSLRNDLIEEYDRQTGEFIGTFLDVKSIGGSRVNDLVYSPTLERYFVASGDTVYELSTSGELLAVFKNDSLLNARGIALFPDTAKANFDSAVDVIYSF